MNIVKLRNAARVLGLGSIMVVGLTFGAGLAKANVFVGGGNNTTGFDSSNQNTWDINHQISVDINNTSTSANDQSFSVDTGHTDLLNNTKVGGIFGGDVFGDITVSNHLNNGDIQLMNTDPGNIAFDLANGTTGFDSLNQNNVNVDVNNSAEINNTASISNALGLSLNTGNDHIGNNTVVGDVRTGDVNFSANVSNMANTGAGNIDLGNLGGVNVSGNLENFLTGAQSTNLNTVDLSASNNIDVNNTANISNSTSVSANSGGNDINNNTVVGNVSTGDVSLHLNTINSAN